MDIEDYKKTVDEYEGWAKERITKMEEDVLAVIGKERDTRVVGAALTKVWIVFMLGVMAERGREEADRLAVGTMDRVRKRLVDGERILNTLKRS